MQQAGRYRGRENPLSPVRIERVEMVGTRFRGRHYGPRPMCAASTGRTHGRTDQPCRTVQFTLAKGEPSTHGDSLPCWMVTATGRNGAHSGHARCGQTTVRNRFAVSSCLVHSTTGLIRDRVWPDLEMDNFAGLAFAAFDVRGRQVGEG